MSDDVAVQMTKVSVYALFQPFEFGGVTLPNRIVMAPMARSKLPGKGPGGDSRAGESATSAGTGGWAGLCRSRGGRAAPTRVGVPSRGEKGRRE